MKSLSKQWKLIIIIGVVALLLGGVYFYLQYSQGRRTQAPSQQVTTRKTPAPQKGDINYNEPVTTVVIGTKEVSKGNFDRVEAGNIYFDSNGAPTQLPFTKDEVVLSCTTQDLAGATKLDYDQITSVHRMTPGELGGRIPANEPIVVFAADVAGVLKAHTVAIAAASCVQ